MVFSKLAKGINLCAKNLESFQNSFYSGSWQLIEEALRRCNIESYQYSSIFVSEWSLDEYKSCFLECQGDILKKIENICLAFKALNLSI